MRGVFLSGLFGALPGFLLAFVPLVLHEMDVITSDQSQIGFVGVPRLFVGMQLGLAWGAAATGHSKKVMVGAIGGLTTDVAGGLVIERALESAGGGPGGLVLITAPLGMLAGGTLGARWGEHQESHAAPPPS